MAAEVISGATPPKILGEVIIDQQGGFSRVRRYLKGWHPDLGRLSYGWQGEETIVELGKIQPIRVFNVVDKKI
ncbi:hypothetical protein HYT74_03845 [Candidatus Daviesbacteria bacterium]|nr:hypothetical protein [Candidatus Daviesbacteria bacterium]